MKTSIDELDIQQVFKLSKFLKKKCEKLPTLEEVAQELTKSLWENFVNIDGEREFALCRIFKSCLYKDFPHEIRETVQREQGAKGMLDQNSFLTLMGTYGDKEAWRAREKSNTHQAFPLYDAQAIQNAPMMRALFQQIGFEIPPPQRDSSIHLNRQDKDFGVFIVEQAKGSKLLPAQEEFISNFEIKSVFGFGGRYSTSNVFAAIVFSKKRISFKKANLFWALAPTFKLAMLENELRGNIFKTQSKTSKDVSLEISLEIQKEIASTTADECGRANAALIELTKELSATNVDLLKEMTKRKKVESDLITAKEEADKANHAKGAFLANMSHEIRTPMNAILGLTSFLKKSPLDKKQSNYLNKIQFSAKNLMAIIDDILDLSKVESGEFYLESIKFDIEECIQHQINLFEAKAGEKGLNLTYDSNEILQYKCIGDPLRLGQVVANLLSNAIKFTSSGEIQVSKKIIAKTSDRVKFEITVKDQGMGIDLETVKNLFQPFTQADDSTTRNYGGTGLGLNICRELLHMMDGDIKVESEPGKGSSFIFTVQLGLSEELAGDGTAVDDKISENILIDTGILEGIKILIVDDDELNTMVAKVFLTEERLSVSVADSGEKACEAIKNNPYDIVLMDIRMPHMDGYQTTRLIRKEFDSTRLPIIALSANAYKDDIEQALAVGMNDYVTKPFDMENLLKKIWTNLPPGHKREKAS